MRKARIFISCGQQEGEKEYGLKVADYFRRRGFDPYFAQKVQTPEALTQNIFQSLQKSEYFVCINFERERTNTGSLFIQQEFAIAAYLELPMLAFHKGKIDLDGIGKYLILKSIEVSSYKEIINNLKKSTKTWDPKSVHQLELTFGNYHSNMVTANNPQAPLSNWIHIIVHNRSKFFYCKNCYAFVESIIETTTGNTILSNNDYKTELIWAGTNDISINIPQDGKRDIDALIWYQGTPNVQFHQRTSSTQYRYPDLNFGKYKIVYGVISDNFPLAKIEVNIEFTSTGVAVLGFNQIM